MKSHEMGVLDLFVIAKMRTTEAGLIAQQLEALANETLKSFCPGYLSTGCDEVLERLQSSGKAADYDLAVLCYEALSFVKSNYKVQELLTEFKRSLPISYWNCRLHSLLCLYEEAFDGDNDPTGYVSELDTEIFDVVSKIYPDTTRDNYHENIKNFLQSVDSARKVGGCYICGNSVCNKC